MSCPADAAAVLRTKIATAFPARRFGAIADAGHAAVFPMTNPRATEPSWRSGGLPVDGLF